MKRAICILAIALMVLSAFAMAQSDRRPRKPSITVGFDESHNPQPGYTLTGDFSKLKQYIENEFGYTVTANQWDWSAGSLNNYDILIIPTRFQLRPTTSELNNLSNWVNNGGCLIILWFSLCEGACTGNLDPATNWPGTQLHDNILSPNGMGSRSQYPGSSDFQAIIGTIGTTPNTINRVVSQQSAWMGKAEGTAKFLATNSSGQYVASYNPKVGSGKIYLIGSLSAFRNAYIDQADNKEFLFNLITDCTGNNGGGGGGGGDDFKIVTVKVRPKVTYPGKATKFITRVKNTDNAQCAAGQVNFYLSLDDTLDPGDIFIGLGAYPALNPGKSKRIKLKLNLPVIASDDYYGIVEIVGTTVVKATNYTVEVQ